MIDELAIKRRAHADARMACPCCGRRIAVRHIQDPPRLRLADTPPIQASVRLDPYCPSGCF